MTAPIIPPEVDLRAFAFMPLDVRRLRDSRLVATRTPEEALAAILLWSASWHQQPASSLPNDDVELSQLAGYGRAVDEFRRIREGALHGFILCGDGRLYHPVVAEKAAEAWNGRLGLEHRKACDRIRKETRDRKDLGEQEVPIPPKPALLSVQVVHGIPRYTRHGSAGIPTETSPHSAGIPASVRAGLGARARPLERDSGKGEGEGGFKVKSTVGQKPPDPAPAEKKDALQRRAVEILAFLNEQTGHAYKPVPATVGKIVARLQEGATDEQCRAVVSLKCREWGNDPKMKTYLRPGTLFCAEKFAQYQGQLVNNPRVEAQPSTVIASILAEVEGEPLAKSLSSVSVPVGFNPEEVAREALARLFAQIERGGYRRLIIEAAGQRSAFSVAELGGPPPRAAESADGSWWKSNDGIAAKGKALKIPYPPTAQQVPGWFYSYKVKVYAAAGPGPWMDTLPAPVLAQIEAEQAAAS